MSYCTDRISRGQWTAIRKPLSRPDALPLSLRFHVPVHRAFPIEDDNLQRLYEYGHTKRRAMRRI